MKVLYTGPEEREFGGKVGDQKFRVPAAVKGEDRLVQFVSFDAEGDEHLTTETTKDVGNVLLGALSDAPRPKDRKPLYAEFVRIGSLADLPQDATPPDEKTAGNVQHDAGKRKG